MCIHLPSPIDLYIRIDNSGDVEAMSECFASNAVVRDEGRTYESLAAITAWKVDAKKKYNHTIAPLELADRDGKTVLKARVAGNFPGSPVTLEFIFVLEDGKIVALEIH